MGRFFAHTDGDPGGKKLRSCMLLLFLHQNVPTVYMPNLSPGAEHYSTLLETAVKRLTGTMPSCACCCRAL
jgi:hypothetical protein